MGNPLAPLMNAQNAGALGGFNPFAEMGVNTNDPNYVRPTAIPYRLCCYFPNPCVYLCNVDGSDDELARSSSECRQHAQ